MKDKKDIKRAEEKANIKVFKIKSTSMQRTAKWILWIFIGFLMLRGIGTLFNSDASAVLDEQISAYKAGFEYEAVTEKKAAAFAEAFCREYLTYKGSETEEYKDRLRKYMADYLLGYGYDLSGDAEAEVLDVVAMTIEWSGEKQLNIDVLAKVKYCIKQKQSMPDEDTTEPETSVNIETVTIKDICLRVPIAESNGSLAVEDCPIVVPIPQKAYVEFSSFMGITAEESDKDKITELMTNFLKTYFEGNEGEIAYYMLNPKEQVLGLSGSFKFGSIESIQVYVDETDKSKYTVIISFAIIDPVSNIDIKQRMHFEIVKKEDRFYISNFDTRTGNMKGE